MNKEKILLISEYFPPDMAGTGMVMEELAHDLQKTAEIRVLAGKTSYFNKELYANYRTNIRVKRIWHPNLNKNLKIGRLLNFIFFPLAVMTRLFSLKKADKIIIVSNPATIIVVGGLANFLFQKKVYYIWQDMYPDLAVELNMATKQSFSVRMMKKINHFGFSRVEKIILLSDKMKEYFAKEYSPWVSKTTVITNWVDTTKIYPSSKDNPWSQVARYKDLFVVLYAGNIGLAYNFDPVLDAAIRLQNEKNIVFLFVGEGAQKTDLQNIKISKNLTNVDFMGYVPNEDYNKLLATADCHIVSIKNGIDNYSFPGKIYSYMASGRPILAITDQRSILAELVTKNSIGFVVSDGAQLADAILKIKNNTDLSVILGQNSRKLAQQSYSRSHVTKQYLEVLKTNSEN
jgi:glycosyltransferase involved in cell wall biosynthesis